MYRLKRKGATVSVKELRPVLKEINRLKKSLMLKEVRGMVISLKDPT